MEPGSITPEVTRRPRYADVLGRDLVEQLDVDQMAIYFDSIDPRPHEFREARNKTTGQIAATVQFTDFEAAGRQFLNSEAFSFVGARHDDLFDKPC
jgi:hypothetical protein